jgi:hypothetical protein
MGQEVVVAYAPENPAEATLETGSNWQVRSQVRMLLICFVLILLLNVLNFYLARLNKRTRSSIPTYGAAETVDLKCWV